MTDVGAEIQIIEPHWPAPSGVKAAFTLRMGGVSVAPYDSLNLGAGIGDSPEAVAENRRRVRDRLRLPAEPVWLEQVHGVEVVRLGGDGAARQPAARAVAGAVKADAAVAHEAGLVCAIRVADCMPVLFAAEDGSAVGGAHAGWRGLAGGVLEATVQQLGVPSSKLWRGWARLLAPSILKSAMTSGLHSSRRTQVQRWHLHGTTAADGSAICTRLRGGD